MKNGVVIIDKPLGITSHDVVNRLRRIYKTKKVGHTGTLDPDATGVLPVCVGQATRLAEYFSADDKRYRATLTFGTETETQDASGAVVATYPLPTLSEADFIQTLQPFIGLVSQEPTMYSAIKYQGQPLYKYARQGITIPDLPSRQVTIYSISLLCFTPERAVFDVHCSKGTYIRTLCTDIAKSCGSGGHMSALRRLASGRFEIERAVTLEILEASLDPHQHMIPMAEALSDIPAVEIIHEQEFQSLQNGRTIVVDTAADKRTDGSLLKIIYQSELVAVGTYEAFRFQPKKVFRIEDAQ